MAIQVRERPRDPNAGRQVHPAAGAAPVNGDVHTHWTRDTPDRIRELENQGYVKAEEADVESNHQGYATAEGIIRKGDLVLMKCQRERVEKRDNENQNYKRRREQGAIAEAEKGAEIEKRSGHGQRRGSRVMDID